MMPRAKSKMPSVAEITKAIKSYGKATGRKVTAVKHHPDGTFRLMSADHPSNAVTTNDNDPALVGWGDVVPYGQA